MTFTCCMKSKGNDVCVNTQTEMLTQSFVVFLIASRIITFLSVRNYGDSITEPKVIKRTVIHRRTVSLKEE